MGVVRRSAGLFGAVRVVAVQTCALIVNGARDVFLVLSPKEKKKKIISRRHSARTGARALLRTDRWKLYDVQEGDVVHTPRLILIGCAFGRRRHGAMFTAGSSRAFSIIFSHVFMLVKKVVLATFGPCYPANNSHPFPRREFSLLCVFGFPFQSSKSANRQTVSMSCTRITKECD
jgi:hypothetical protein